MKRKIIISAFMVIGLIGFLRVQPAQALTLIPPSFEFDIAAGQTVDTKVKIFNEEQETKVLYTETASFTAAGETGNPQYDFSIPTEGLSSWFEVEKGPITIEPGERLEIPVKILVPQDAEPGGHYAILAFSPNSPDTGGQSGVAITAALGALFLVNVEGDVVEQGTVREFSLDHESAFFSRLPAQFFVRYANTGNVHLRPTGTITITNLFGNTSGTLEVNPTKGATLPDSIRKYDAVWERSMVTESTGNAWQTFWHEYGNERANFAFGKYTAQLSLTAGTDKLISDSSSVTFWVIPWHLCIVYGVGLIILIVLLFFFIKRYNKWIISRASASQAAASPTEGSKKP